VRFFRLSNIFGFSWKPLARLVGDGRRRLRRAKPVRHYPSRGSERRTLTSKLLKRIRALVHERALIDRVMRYNARAWWKADGRQMPFAEYRARLVAYGRTPKGRAWARQKVLKAA
jgi:hypothetical protein